MAAGVISTELEAILRENGVDHGDFPDAIIEDLQVGIRQSSPPVCSLLSVGVRCPPCNIRFSRGGVMPISLWRICAT
jgi:hypothetical protein